MLRFLFLLFPLFERGENKENWTGFFFFSFSLPKLNFVVQGKISYGKMTVTERAEEKKIVRGGDGRERARGGGEEERRRERRVTELQHLCQH